MTEIELPRLRCYRCFYEWVPRKTHVPACPRCRSRLYATPKIRKWTPGNGLGIEDVLTPKREAIYRLARRYGVKKLYVFGSIRRHEGRPDSDVDLLVVWRGRHSLLDRLGLAAELEKLIGRRVELANRGGLNWTIEPQVEAEAVPL